MKNKITFFILIVTLFIVGCTQGPLQEPLQEKEPETPVVSAAESSDVEEEEVEEEPEAVMDEAVKELLEEGKAVKSIFYKYKGPDTGNFYYEFYVKWDKVKYIPSREIKSLDEEDSYNAIYLDKMEKTAEAYCDDRQCVYKGKKSDLIYVDYYILTPFDWLDKIITAEKVGEELIGTRKTWKLEANDNIEAWVDVFYGVLLQVVQNDEKYEFTQMTFNDVKDSDVTPS